MTSGTFATFPVSAIWVNREVRQRRELRNIEELAASIAQSGLIHPPVIKRDGELIVGERRWTAVKSLGWTDISVQFIEDLSDEELRRVELEENTKRLDLTWQERTAAVADYHALRSSEPGWTKTKTAEALGYSGGAVTQFLDVAAEIARGNKMVIEAPKYSTAMNITARRKTRENAATIVALPPVATSSLEVVEKEPDPIPLLNADFEAWSTEYSGPKFNLIHCDFPYGVNMHKSDQGAGASFGTYADEENVYWKLLEVLRAAMSNVVHDSAHLIFWFSMDYYADTKLILESMGWKVNPFPLIWVKSDNTGIIPDANRGPRRIYETAFFASRGDRPVVSPVSNAFSYPGREKEIHMNEKPVAMLRHFLRMFTDEYTFFLDPTCGSANAVKAARSLGAANVLGIECDENFFTLAYRAFNAPQD
jgi:ParB/RepB/Spo0J family partition protein